MRKIVYVGQSPSTAKIRRDWYIDDLRAAGRQVEFWDTSALWNYRPGRQERSGPASGDVVVDSVERLTGLFSAQDNRDAIFVLLMRYEPRFQPLFRLLSEHRCTTCIFEVGHKPLATRSAAARLGTLLTRPSQLASAVKRKAVAALSRRLDWVKPFDVVFAGGSAAARIHPAAGRTVAISMCDFENYSATKSEPRLIAGDYALFLDSNHALNPDRAFVGMAPIDVGRYFAALNRFFGLVERKLKIPVVVALHPKSEYDSERFEGRPCYRNATPALVRHATFATCHMSTSISYVVLAKIPVALVYTDEMLETIPDFEDNARALGDYLGMPALNLDRIADFSIAPVDPGRYEAFKYEFLTWPEAENRPTREIVLREFDRLDKLKCSRSEHNPEKRSQ